MLDTGGRNCPAPSNASFCTVHTSPDCAGNRSEFPKIAFYPHSHCSRCKKVTFCSIRLMLGFACWKLLKVLRRDSTLFRRKESEEFDSFRAMFVPDPRCAIIRTNCVATNTVSFKIWFRYYSIYLEAPTEYVIQPRVARNAPMNDYVMPRHTGVPHMDSCQLTSKLYAARYLKLLKIGLRIQPCQAQDWFVPNERWSRSAFHVTKIAQSNTKQFYFRF